MPSIDSTPLTGLFEEIDTTSDEKTKSSALGKAKYFILNEMTSEAIKEVFAKDKLNFESLFALKIWKSKLQEAIVDYMEPYEIMEKIFGSFATLVEYIDEFYGQILFTINQNEDEKVKHICVRTMIKLTKALSKIYKVFFLQCP